MAIGIASTSEDATTEKILELQRAAEAP